MSLLSFNGRDKFNKMRADVARQNKSTFTYYVLIGLIMSLVLLIIKENYSMPDTLVRGTRIVNYCQLIYFVLIAVFRKFIVKLLDKEKAVALMYLLITPPIVASMLTGAVFVPGNKEAFIFFFYIIIFPLFVMDIPIRVIMYITGMSAAFAILVFLKKDTDTRMYDLFHIFEFYIGSFIVNIMMLKLRLNNIEYVINAQEDAQRDYTTGLPNRQAFMRRISEYDGKRIAVGVVGIDDYSFFNDMYGHEISEAIINEFSKILKKHFDKNDVYRMTMENFLVVAEYENINDIAAILKEMRKEIKGIVVNQQNFHPTFTVGYVYGKNNDHDLSKMYRIADLYYTRSHNHGKGRSLGAEYDPKDDFKSDGTERRDIGVGIDPLTGAMDMTMFVRDAERIIHNTLDKDRKVDFIYINIENFKVFNEQNGFTAGDELLKYVADQLKLHFPGRQVARFADDHFVVLCFDDEILKNLQYIAGNVKNYVSNSTVGLKAGIYTYEDKITVNQACDNAKAACESIKNNVDVIQRYYDKSLEYKSKMVKYVLKNFDTALKDGWIKVFYQPVISHETGKICGAETLSRWVDPEKGMISPGDYIPILEDNRLIKKYDLYVIEMALSEFEKRKDSFGFPISVNLSRHDFYDKDIVKLITDMTDKHNISHDKLHIEITESAFTENVDYIKGQVDAFHDAGFEVWMDDFGSGYSSLNLLQDFDFDLIKLDMRFMKDFKVGNKNSIIVKQVIEMARELNIHTLTEGVETENQKNFLNNVGCERIQGYYYSKPDTLDNIKNRVKEGSLPELE